MSTLRTRTLSGLKWSGASQVFAQILKFGVSVLLARLLDPSSFGLMAMVTFFTGIAFLFVDLGLGSALVQREELTERHISTVFWVNLGVGLLLALVFALSAPLIANFYAEPKLTPLVLVCSILFPLNSLQIVQRNLIFRSIAFKKLFRVDVAASMAGGIAAVIAALQGLGVWALVIQQATVSLLSVIILWVFSPWRPKLLVDRQALRDVWGFGGNLLGYQILNYGSRNIDNLMIGRFLGPQALGLYSRAYSLMLMPIAEVTSVFTRVMFPVMASIQNDLAMVRKIYLRAVRSIALITFPMMAGLVVAAEPFVITLLGESWRPMIPILQILSIGGMFQSISGTVGWIFTSQGRTDIIFRWGIVSLIVTLIAFVVGIQWGVIGVAACYVFASVVVLLVPSWYISGRIIGLSVGETIANLLPTLGCSIVMAGIVWLVGVVMPDTWHNAAQLFVQVSVGALTYWGLAHFLNLVAYREVLQLLQKELRLPWLSRITSRVQP